MGWAGTSQSEVHSDGGRDNLALSCLSLLGSSPMAFPDIVGPCDSPLVLPAHVPPRPPRWGWHRNGTLWEIQRGVGISQETDSISHHWSDSK